MHISKFGVTAGCVWLALAGLSLGANPVMDELLNKGLQIGADRLDKVQPPEMKDGLSKEEQQKVIATLVKNAGIDLGAFLENQIHAAHICPPMAEGNRPPDGMYRKFDLYFTAYGDLQTVADEGFLRKQADEASEEQKREDARKPKTAKSALPSKVTELKDADLQARHLTVQATPGLKERYAFFEVALFDEVQVQGIIHGYEEKNNESVTACVLLDPRFAQDSAHPNQWRKIGQNQATGKPTYGPTHPYAGVGGYVKATKLQDPAGAIFVEYHLVFNEPHDWFSGGRVLDSKLPTAAREGVQKFRAKLRNAKAAP